MPRYTAKTADKYALYEEAVQCVEADIDFIEKTYKKAFGKKPRLLREDFCGTASAAVEFVKRSKKNRAVGIDLDPEVLAYGRKHHLPKLKDRQSDLVLRQTNVMDVSSPKADVIMAMNFSYFCFKEREVLKQYFRVAHKSLKPEGMLFLDAYGGSEAQDPQKEPRKNKGFTYVWDQYSFNPITSDVVNYIHFKFPDGTRIKRAFTYEWRLWTLREITELLAEVGFSKSDVFWEGWDEKGEDGNGIFTPQTEVENSAGWVAYIVASR